MAEKDNNIIEIDPNDVPVLQAAIRRIARQTYVNINELNDYLSSNPPTMPEKVLDYLKKFYGNVKTVAEMKDQFKSHPMTVEGVTGLYKHLQEIKLSKQEVELHKLTTEASKDENGKEVPSEVEVLKTVVTNLNKYIENLQQIRTDLDKQSVGLTDPSKKRNLTNNKSQATRMIKAATEAAGTLMVAIEKNEIAQNLYNWLFPEKKTDRSVKIKQLDTAITDLNDDFNGENSKEATDSLMDGVGAHNLIKGLNRINRAAPVQEQTTKKEPKKSNTDTTSDDLIFDENILEEDGNSVVDEGSKGANPSAQPKTDDETVKTDNDTAQTDGDTVKTDGDSAKIDGQTSTGAQQTTKTTDTNKTNETNPVYQLDTYDDAFKVFRKTPKNIRIPKIDPNAKITPLQFAKHKETYTQRKSLIERFFNKVSRKMPKRYMKDSVEIPRPEKVMKDYNMVKGKNMVEYQTSHLSKGKRFLNHLGKAWLLASFGVTVASLGLLTAINPALGLATALTGIRGILFNPITVLSTVGVLNVGKYFLFRRHRQAAVAQVRFLNREKKVKLKIANLEQDRVKLQNLRKLLNDKMSNPKKNAKSIETILKSMSKVKKGINKTTDFIDREFNGPAASSYNKVRQFFKRLVGRDSLISYKERSQKALQIIDRKKGNNNHEKKFDLQGNLDDCYFNWHNVRRNYLTQFRGNEGDSQYLANVSKELCDNGLEDLSKLAKDESVSTDAIEKVVDENINPEGAKFGVIMKAADMAGIEIPINEIANPKHRKIIALGDFDLKSKQGSRKFNDNISIVVEEEGGKRYSYIPEGADKTNLMKIHKLMDSEKYHENLSKKKKKELEKIEQTNRTLSDDGGMSQ